MTKSLQSGAKVKPERITVGRVGAPHGLAGELKIQSLTDFPERFEEMDKVQVGDEILHIAGVRYDAKAIYLKFKEYTVREEAAKLTGRLLTVSRDEAMPLEEGEYYTFDIIGLSVYDRAGKFLGTVENVLRTGSNDVYQARDKNGREVLIPALKSVVKKISLAKGRMEVDLMEELSDAN